MGHNYARRPVFQRYPNASYGVRSNREPQAEVLDVSTDETVEEKETSRKRKLSNSEAASTVLPPSQNPKRTFPRKKVSKKIPYGCPPWCIAEKRKDCNDDCIVISDDSPEIAESEPPKVQQETNEIGEIVFVEEVRKNSAHKMPSTSSVGSSCGSPTSDTLNYSNMLISHNRQELPNDGYSLDCATVPGSTRRVFVDVQNANVGTENGANTYSDFTVCSYNVLCQDTITRTQYLYGHLKYFRNLIVWSHRWKKMEKEILSIDADIFGMQEKCGMDGLKQDGCAIFYKNEKFSELYYREVDYFVACQTTLDREQIAQIVVLRCKATNEVLIIANTHLIFNENRGDVKLAQLAKLFANIHEVSEKFRDSSPSLIILGDFNIEPNSLIYKYIVTGWYSLMLFEQMSEVILS
ncbi:unnamed protein product [Caenorhabditis bovis]|uniref:Endonuclease/exonuclease/phosphatase domain-containing protein n=1 Tax=Caenorhabditis bovis TaxID=2654633 RepID=A0A8S1EIX8_9PELO|nr:unnamed protein product [Caenorhabditis bovis]